MLVSGIYENMCFPMLNTIKMSVLTYICFFAHYETILTLLYSLYGLYNSVYIWGSQKTPEYRGGHCKTPEYRVREEKK